MTDALRAAIDAALVAEMSPDLRSAIDDALARGERPGLVLARVRRAAGGRAAPIALAVEAYLGRGPDGRCPRA